MAARLPPLSPDLKLGGEIVQNTTMIGGKKPFFKESLNPSNFFGFWSWVSGWVDEKCRGELKPSKTRFPETPVPNWGVPQAGLPRNVRFETTELDRGKTMFSNDDHDFAINLVFTLFIIMSG